MSSLRSIAGDMTLAAMQHRLQMFGREATARDQIQPGNSVSCGNCADGWIVDRDRRARRCDCWLRARHMPGVPSVWRALRLADVDRNTGNRAAVEAIERFARRESGGPICLSGDPGTGKSFLAAAGGNERFWSGDALAFYLRFCDYVDAQRRGLNFADTDGYANAKRLESRARTAEPLVIDDFGAGAKDSEYTQQQLFTLLLARGDSGRSTILTTNLSVDDMAARLDDRIISRLFAGEVINVRGADRRLERSRKKVVSMRSTSR